ncbi:MAG TPA: TraM recognition domain-containing protein [Solirubrobacteraceae bacterium]|nr:TraM recognition domain-containing protein [Solirubrobacteraceae bacterium]
MKPRPRLGAANRWRDYLSLAAFAGLLTMPMPVAVAAGATLVAGRVAMAMRRRARTQPARGAAGAGVVLGRDRAGRPVTLSDEQLAAHALVVGAAGAGKSTTMLAILSDHIARGRPVVALDMKGSPAFARELGRAAALAGRELRVWTPDGPSHWNPLAHGNATALKDMLISTERFSEPHYQRAAERYLQTAFTVLDAAHPGRPAHLDDVVAVMEPARLASRLRDVPSPLAARVADYLGGLTRDQESAVRGLGTRLALLSESTAGRYLAPGDGPAVDLATALEGGDVVLLSLNSSVYGKLAAQLGALAIQAVTSAAGHRLRAQSAPSDTVPTHGGPGPIPATFAIDEFSALGADNLLALLARGREAGVPVLLATQELSDLERAGRGFRDQVMGIVGVTIAHRQDVHSSATMISQLAGTEWTWQETETVRGLFARPGLSRGTRRMEEQPVVHPNEIKTLRVGEMMMIAKLPSMRIDRVAVSAPLRVAPARLSPATPRTPSPGLPQPRVERGSPGRRPPPDQAAPGVTR